MDSAMRDIEQLRERNDDGEGRPLALVGILIGVTVVLVLAMGMAVGGFGESDEAAENDPLARLGESAGLEIPEDADQRPELPAVRRSDLTFPEALGAPIDERPEVVAALAAAAAELAHPDPIGGGLVPRLPALEPDLPGGLPGFATGAPVRDLARDPMMVDTRPAPPGAPAAPAGRDGEYTVQVISYDSPEGAEAFSAALRGRGHRAFVISAQVEGRGTVYRVRVGPFETVREAQAYRHEFERTERMNTLLVRRRDGDA